MTAGTDLVILGATPGGITAAIAAARLAKRSILLERTPYIGGLPANGLGATDIATRGATGGLFLEFVQRIKAHYLRVYGADSEQVRDCDDGYHFEPSVAEKVFHQWLSEYPQITVLTRRQFDFEPGNVKLRDGTIESIRIINLSTGGSEAIRGSFFLDATYEGDLIAAAGVPFFLGREGEEIYGELGAGRLYKKWNGPEGAGTTHCGDNAVQAYNFRLCLTDNPDNRVKIRRPSKYDRDEFVSLIEDVQTGRHAGVRPQDHAAQDNLRGIRRLLSNVRLPNHKVDGNNQHLAFISTDLPEENWPYPTSGWAWRDKFARRLREYTEGLLYFAQNDTALPSWFREECSHWGWAADEYIENGYFPRQLYVREGRRMKGKKVFTAADVLPQYKDCHIDLTTTSTSNGVVGHHNVPALREPRQTAGVHSTSITASHYALDSHAVRKREPDRVHLDGFFSYPCSSYTVPYEVMVPDAPLKNLLAPVPVSASHVGFSTLRMEPCWMALGQAAGVATALCLDSGVAAEEVDVDKLQRELLDQGAVLVYNARLWKNGVTAEQRKEMQWEWLQSAKDT